MQACSNITFMDNQLDIGIELEGGYATAARMLPWAISLWFFILVAEPLLFKNLSGVCLPTTLSFNLTQLKPTHDVSSHTSGLDFWVNPTTPVGCTSQAFDEEGWSWHESLFLLWFSNRMYLQNRGVLPCNKNRVTDLYPLNHIEKILRELRGGFTYICFMRIEPNGRQKHHLVNAWLGWRNKNHPPLQNRMEHICQQDLCRIPGIINHHLQN